MQKVEVVIIGAGAAGLMAARTLVRAGRRVAVVEARNRPGGRIHSFAEAGFSTVTEAGAEFLHGTVPLTRALLDEAHQASIPTTGTTYQVVGGQRREAEDFIQDLPALVAQLHALPHDLPLTEFLARYFSAEQYAPLREQVTRFAEGYDAADTTRASSFALRDELSGGGFDDSPHPAGGYGRLIERLVAELEASGVALHLSTVVRAIGWRPGQVTIETEDGRLFRASQAIVTLPLGIWQAAANSPSYLRFEPDLPAHRAAAANLGYGAVIKVLLEFKDAFWQHASPDVSQPMPDLSFLFSDAPFPTWWSQLPDPRPLLTGWLAGPAATRRRGASQEVLLTEALNSLAGLLGSTPGFLRTQLRAHRIVDWGADPYALGAYAYSTVGAGAARAALATPVAHTLFFAGEGVHDGPYIGTVEAALASGVAAAHRLLESTTHA